MQTADARKTRRPACKGSECVTDGIRVNVFPTYMPDHSDTASRQWVFGYRVRIGNESDVAVQLLKRRWTIVDAHGRQREVKGDGVVDQQPIIRPGKAFEYSSFCPMQTRWGTMEGHYVVQCEGDERQFDVNIARFYLVAPETA